MLKKSFLFFCLFLQITVFGQVLIPKIPKSVFELQREEFDRLCNADKQKAKKDAKTQTIYFVNIPAPGGSDFIQKNEFAEILKKDNVQFGGIWMGNDLPNRYTAGECYKIAMTRYAEKKFGEKYFKEKSAEALKIYLEKNPEKIFDYRYEELDFSPIIVGMKTSGEQQKFINENFWAKYELPKTYINRNKDELHSYINAYFIIDQNGKISQLQTEATLQNSENEKLKKYLEESFEKYILSLEFQPQTYHGFKVKSRQNITIWLP